jgi:hypothetical protein
MDPLALRVDEFVSIDDRSSNQKMLYFSRLDPLEKQKELFSTLLKSSKDPKRLTPVFVTGRIHEKVRTTGTAKGMVVAATGDRDFDLGGNCVVLAYFENMRV